MLVIIPPSITMDKTPVHSELTTSTPEFKDMAEYLIHIFSDDSIEGLSKLFGISEELAEKAYNEYREFLVSNNTKAAIFAFTGPLFKTLDPEKFTYNQFYFAQNHIRILSSIYGILKPLDAIKEYRSTFKIKNDKLPEQNLYDFWKDKITSSVKKDAEADNKQILFLAFHDLLKAINIDKLGSDMKFAYVTFKENKNGELITIREYEKEAIAHMTSWIIKENILNINDIKHWNMNGYSYSNEMSDDGNLIFIRNQK